MSTADPTTLLASRLEEAVQEEDFADRLEGWLQGLGLPALNDDQEPYVWILRALDRVQERAALERKLAHGLAEILEKKPDLDPLGEAPDQLLYNALNLAAGLACSDELWEPLLDILDREELSGGYRGIEHRGSLSSALAQNQGDSRLGALWLLLATDGGSDALPNNWSDGFEGLLYMPDPQHGRGYPHIPSVAHALDSKVQRLGSTERSTSQLRGWVNRLLQIYPGLEQEIARLLRSMSDRYVWPEWARSALPEPPDAAALSFWFEEPTQPEASKKIS